MPVATERFTPHGSREVNRFLFAGRLNKQKGLDLYVLDLTDKEQRTTRYYISAKTLHILWLEYSEGNAKFSKRFADYRYAQSTLVPFRTILFEDDKQTQETRILTVTFGVKVDDALFKNPSA
jgi:hypothetical protein